MFFGVWIELAEEIGMFILFPGLTRVDVSLELLSSEGDATINAIPYIRDAKFLMTRYPFSFHWEGVHSNKQTRN